MPKFRIVPIVLTNGVSVVKGKLFDSQRVVGTVPSIGRVFAARAVDELCLLDVRATSDRRPFELSLISEVSQVLRVPFSAGGGVRSVTQIAELLSKGADKVVLGKVLLEDYKLAREAANLFGSQSLVASVNVSRSGAGAPVLYDQTGKNLRSHLLRLQDAGIGEILIQNPLRDGTMVGVDVEIAQMIGQAVDIPFVCSGGAKDWKDALALSKAGASGIGIGALFQFTESTPEAIKQKLRDAGVDVRI